MAADGRYRSRPPGPAAGMSRVPPRGCARRPAYTSGMQGMISGVLVVAAFAVVAAAAGFVATRLYRVSRWASPGEPGGPGQAGEPTDA
jgi:hypothetical protein